MNWNLLDKLRKYATPALAIFTCAGTIATGVASAIETRNCERDPLPEEATLTEKVERFIKNYKVTLLCGLSTMAGIGGLYGLNKATEAELHAILTAADLVTVASERYFGDGSQEQLSEYMKREIENDDVPWDRVQTFYLDAGVPRFFDRTMLDVVRAECLFNRTFALKGEISLNDYLYILNVPLVDEEHDILVQRTDKVKWIDFVYKYIEADDGMMICSIEMPAVF